MAPQKILGARSHGRTPDGTPSIKERWAAARASGFRSFDPGVECVNGHRSDRWTNNGICIECKRARDNVYNATHAEEHRRRARESAVRRPDEIKAYRKRYYRDDAQKFIARTKEWVQSNPERARAAKRAWGMRNRDSINARQTAARHADPERFRRHGREWKRRNPHKVREYDSRRRAREIGAALGDRRQYAAFVRRMRSAKRIKCYWCAKTTRPEKRHLDHIIPLAKGGADATGNICVACPSCNQSKNAKMPEQFSGQSELHLA